MPTAFSTTSVLPGFEISTDPGRLDLDFVYRELNASYWAADRSRAEIERAIRGSIPFGVYWRGASAGVDTCTPTPGDTGPAGGRQVAFGRVITDAAVFAYLADVVVAAGHRGKGIGKGLMRAVLAHPDLQTIRVFLLRTRDAHGLYRQFGFGPLPNPEEVMVRGPGGTR